MITTIPEKLYYSPREKVGRATSAELAGAHEFVLKSTVDKVEKDLRDGLEMVKGERDRALNREADLRFFLQKAEEENKNIANKYADYLLIKQKNDENHRLLQELRLALSDETLEFIKNFISTYYRKKPEEFPFLVRLCDFAGKI